ncbi:MAG TPA: PBP1A family penicillin-binding protein, partial [Vicinamibacteria bacterium]|nr:PBP1A family penicillin-binding protein [Vicinamibacteria bacterium]
MSERHIYSPKRLRVVVALLTLLTLPVVIGSSVLIYYYLRYGVMVERRLKGERWMIPSRLYGRPLVLREGLALTLPGFLKVLNELKYDKREGGALDRGQFSVSEKAVTFSPRPASGGASEALVVAFEKDHLKDMKGVTTKKPYKTQPLEPELITYLFDDSREKKRLVKYEELPDHLIKAVLAIEDRRFFSHPGLDPFRIIGAALRNLRAESYIQGGSTITQQLVKNFFLSPERKVKRKVQEALLALALERRADKKDILQLYLNEVYLGQVGSFSIQGVGEASRMYFHKDVATLTLSESALLAGMIQSPNPYNPYRHARAALKRRNQVLDAMRDAGFIDQATAEAATAEPLRVDAPTLDTAEAPYFVDLVKAQLGQRYESRDLSTQNLSVYTTLDLHLQSLAQEALRGGLEKDAKLVKRKDGTPLQGCVIVIEPQTGAIVALVGGRSYGASQYNRVTSARRQPGSTFKPFVYLAAFEATFEEPELPPITPATLVEDAPSVFFFEDKEYTPQNYEDKYMGVVTLRTALAHSLNSATVRVAEMVGYDRVASLWTKKLGLGTNVKPYPAVALGSFEATPLEMATAYNVLANGGLKVDPVTVLKVTDEKEQTLEQHRLPAPPRVVHAESAFLVTSMLRSVLNEGTGAAARTWGFASDAAGKTGTTNEMRDAWFAGYTPDLLCVVWVG